jgi:hypothetical protein
MDDDNPLKLDDWGCVGYHNSLIQKCKTLVNGRLEDKPTSEVWREVAEFHLEDGEAEDYYTRKSSKAQRLSGMHKRLCDGVSDWARKWALPDNLMHRYGKKRTMQPVRKTVMTIPRAMKKTVSQQLAVGGIIIKCLTKRPTSEWKRRQQLPQNKGNRLQQLIKTENGMAVKRYLGEQSAY